MTSRALPNDDCSITKQLELDFINRHQLKLYTQTDAPKRCGILISRALRSSYAWPETLEMTVETLGTFSDVGHTLGLDYQAMYVRNLAFDLDCVCRADPKSAAHLNEALARAVEEFVKTTIAKLLDVKDAKSSKWSNGCGFHLYFDVAASMETHLFIGQLANAQFSSDDVCIEVPRIMPLPFSAKISRAPYRALLPTQKDPPLLPNFDDGFHTLFEYAYVFAPGISHARIRTRSGDLFCNRLLTPRKKYGETDIRYIQEITIYPEHEYLRPLEAFMKRVALTSDNNLRNELNIKTRESSILCNDPKIMEKFTSFMLRFNKMFTDTDSVSCDSYINFALLNHESLYLQHYVVLLHKNLEPITDHQMRQVLRDVFEQESNPIVERFIKYYDSRTLNSYSDTADEMMNHLHFLYNYNVSPFASLSEQLESLLQIALCEESSAAFRRSLETDETKKARIEKAILTYCKFVIEMKIVMYNTSSSNYYILNDLGTHYKIASKQEGYPVIFNWVGSTKSRKEEVFNYLEMFRSKYTINQSELLSRCKFQISTTTGVFNSVIGLYTAKSRFLRFLCYRDSAIWKLNTKYEMYPKQNHECIEHYKTVEPYVVTLFNDIAPMFVHFLLAPAFIQLRCIFHIEEYQIRSMINLLVRFQSLDSAYFLIEYFPIDPKFIFVIMYIYTKYDNFNTLDRYQVMIDHIFHIFDCDQVTKNTWRDKFDPIVADMTYTEHDTHLETLLSISYPDLDDVSEDFCLYATLLAVCFIKCRTFDTMCEAFGVVELPPPKSEHPEYKRDFNWDTSLSAASVNLHRAVRIVFPGDHSEFEKNIILSMFAVCMSTYFDPSITKDFIVCISSIFLSSNVLKKCFIMSGPSGTGKSLFSDIIQLLASPKVGRYTSLSDAMDRANVTLKNNVIIINEMKVVDGDKIKAVTGNDAESTKQFYSQEYEMHTNQSLMFGATNSIIKFRGDSYVDYVSVRRFHVVKLCGQQMLPDFKSSSMFNMMTNSQLYSGTMKPSECELTNLANGISWISFCSYMLYRDDNLYPKIDTDSACNQEYCELVYRSNNKMYDFLVNNGIVDAPGFHIKAERFINTIKLAIRNSKNDTNSARSFGSFYEFKKCFDSFGIPLTVDGVIQNYQEIGLINHIRRNMRVVESERSCITRKDIMERTLVYSDNSDRENAESYFARENKKYYSYVDEVYKNIEFVQRPVSYENNRITNDRDQLYEHARLDLAV